MIKITSEILDELAEEHYKKHNYTTDFELSDDFMQNVKDTLIGLHINEKESFRLFEACYEIYLGGYNEGYGNS